MQKKSDFSRQILKLLSEKNAISLGEIAQKVISSEKTTKESYALARSLKGLKEAGLIESVHSGQQDYARLTKEGKRKATSVKLENEQTLLNPTWDGKWRIVLLDLPESRKQERESLRYLLKKAGFVMVKNSVWVSPYPFEHMFINIKKDLELETELMIIVSDTIDQSSEKKFFEWWTAGRN